MFSWLIRAFKSKASAAEVRTCRRLGLLTILYGAVLLAFRVGPAFRNRPRFF
jgi:hypothetical protein